MHYQLCLFFLSQKFQLFNDRSFSQGHTAWAHRLMSYGLLNGHNKNCTFIFLFSQCNATPRYYCNRIKMLISDSTILLINKWFFFLSFVLIWPFSHLACGWWLSENIVTTDSIKFHFDRNVYDCVERDPFGFYEVWDQWKQFIKFMMLNKKCFFDQFALLPSWLAYIEWMVAPRLQHI